jgi:hypothetical protein
MATQNPYSDSLLMDALRGSLSNAESLGRGFGVAPIGLLGDINALARQYVTPRLPQSVQGLLQSAPAAPTTEQILSNIPRVSNPRMETAGMEQLGAAMNPRGPVELAKAMKNMPVGMSIKDVGSFKFPQEEALRLAQQRAALPKEQFGLGLPPNNTAQQRADAMFPFDVYHGTNADIPVMNVAGKGKTSGAGAFVNDNPLAAETYVNASGGGNIIPMRMSKEGLLSVNAKGRNWADIETNTLAPKAGKKRYSLEDMELSKNDVTSTDELGVIAKDLLGLQGVDIKNVKDLGPNSHIFRAKEYLQDKYGIAPDETWSNVTGKQFQEARDYMDKLYKSQKSTVTAVQDPDLLRSRFAAYDPFRRTAAIAAATGVAAPDLLAQEQPVITQQQIDDELAKYGLLGR